MTLNDIPPLDDPIFKNLTKLEIYLYVAKLIIPRLERVTPDSPWSHRAIGLRRSLLQLVDLPSEMLERNLERLYAAVEQGFVILENAARDKAH